ncbi:MAG: RNA methyltransferase [Clostridiales bacterium]|nr:RNA methyltransferase [Candidatus Cacconaster stercorequi]
METITSRTNPLMTHIRKLSSSGSYRRQQGEFLCDSPKLLREALLWGAELLTVVCTDPAALPELPRGVRCVTVPKDVMASVSPMKSPQGVLFTCRLPGKQMPDRLPGRRYMVLDGVQDPGNVGTIWRTADAFDCDGLLLLPGCADPYSPKTVRASMGAVFRCGAWQMEPQELKALLQRSEIPLYGAALRDDTLDARKVDYTRAAIAIGSEGRGLTEEMLALCDRTIRIPMSARCESLNAAIAAAVLLWESYRGQ